MNTSILQKVLKELQTDDPNIDYVCGILETLIEMSGESSKGRTTDFGPVNVGSIPTSPKQFNPVDPFDRAERELNKDPQDEGAILTAKAKASVANIRKLAEKGIEEV